MAAGEPSYGTVAVLASVLGQEVMCPNTSLDRTFRFLAWPAMMDSSEHGTAGDSWTTLRLETAVSGDMTSRASLICL